MLVEQGERGAGRPGLAGGPVEGAPLAHGDLRELAGREVAPADRGGDESAHGVVGDLEPGEARRHRRAGARPRGTKATRQACSRRCSAAVLRGPHRRRRGSGRRRRRPGPRRAGRRSRRGSRRRARAAGGLPRRPGDGARPDDAVGVQGGEDPGGDGVGELAGRGDGRAGVPTWAPAPSQILTWGAATVTATPSSSPARDAQRVGPARDLPDALHAGPPASEGGPDPRACGPGPPEASLRLRLLPRRPGAAVADEAARPARPGARGPSPARRPRARCRRRRGRPRPRASRTNSTTASRQPSPQALLLLSRMRGLVVPGAAAHARERVVADLRAWPCRGRAGCSCCGGCRPRRPPACRRRRPGRRRRRWPAPSRSRATRLPRIDHLPAVQLWRAGCCSGSGRRTPATVASVAPLISHLRVPAVLDRQGEVDREEVGVDQRAGRARELGAYFARVSANRPLILVEPSPATASTPACSWMSSAIQPSSMSSTPATRVDPLLGRALVGVVVVAGQRRAGEGRRVLLGAGRRSRPRSRRRRGRSCRGAG